MDIEDGASVSPRLGSGVENFLGKETGEFGEDCSAEEISLGEKRLVVAYTEALFL